MSAKLHHESFKLFNRIKLVISVFSIPRRSLSQLIITSWSFMFFLYQLGPLSYLTITILRISDLKKCKLFGI